MESPVIPITPEENAGSSQGPLGATPRKREFRINRVEAIARGSQSGSFVPVFVFSSTY